MKIPIRKLSAIRISISNMSGPPANQDSSPLSLPIVTVQPTTPSVIQDVHSGLMPSDKIWVSCYKADEPSVHAKVQVSLDEVRRDIVDLTSVEGDVEVVRGHGHSWRVSRGALVVI